MRKGNVRVILGAVVTAVALAACASGSEPEVASTARPDAAIESSASTMTTIGSTTTSTYASPSSTSEPEQTTTTKFGAISIELDAVLEAAYELDGISPGGFDSSHGAPYSAFGYTRGAAELGLIAVLSDSDPGLASRLAFGAFTGPAIAGDQVIVHGHVVTMYEAETELGLARAAVVTEVCDRYDVWAFGFVEDLEDLNSILAEDVAAVASANECD